MTLHARWLGRVPYVEADTIQRALHERTSDDYLLLLEHPHVYTLGKNAHLEHVLVPPASVGAELVKADRGGDVTYHGPGQLVGYPVITLRSPDVVKYVRDVEDVLIRTLADFGIDAGRSDGYTGVWVGDEKIAAIGVRVGRGRTRHGFALNVTPDLSMFDHIVPCGISDRGVTSMEQLLSRRVPMSEVVDAVMPHFADVFGFGAIERADVHFSNRDGVSGADVDVSRVQHSNPEDWRGAREMSAAGPHDVAVRLRRRAEAAGVDTDFAPNFDRPDWMKVKANLGEGYRELKKLTKGLNLHTVCEEAGCPNIYECWADRTATFMILGERCTRACGFCLVDTRKPLAADPEEPARVADAVATLGLEHAVITCVARDDLADGGAGAFAETVHAVRARSPRTQIELLISDCEGRADSLDTIFDSGPDVLNHNLETVARLQRMARPKAGYARSLAVLARAKSVGLVTKSGLIAGMGETDDEMRQAVRDLRNVGVDILTVGQYLRPTGQHLPVVRWWTPQEFDALREYAESLGFAHVEAGPLVRSSYHAKQATQQAAPAASVSALSS